MKDGKGTPNSEGPEADSVRGTESSAGYPKHIFHVDHIYIYIYILTLSDRVIKIK